MHKEYEIIGNKVIINNGLDYKEERKTVDNIEEILITENNIEEIENLVNKEKKKIKTSKKKIKEKTTLPLIVSSLHFINLILYSIQKKLLLAIGQILCSFIWLYNSLFTIIPEKKLIKESKKVISILEEEKNKEKEKLKELEKNQDNNFMSIAPITKTISTSEQIRDLKNKLHIIRYYESNKRKLIKYYKKGILQNTFGYWDDEIKFIEELIKNDLNNKNEEKIKQKIKKEN